MGLTESLGLGNYDIPSIQSFGGFFSGVAIFILIVFFLLLSGGITFYYYYKKSQKQNFKYTVFLYKDVNGKPYFVGSDKARELKIPSTNVRILWWQKSKFYSAYPTRPSGDNLYKYKINRFGELHNFDLTSDEKDNAKMDYDHRDQTYAYLNLQELIKRNYADKTTKWWKENLPLISVIVTGLMMIIAMWFFFRMSGNFIEQLGVIAKEMNQASKNMADAMIEFKNFNSGIIR